jgi:hypothetical protein
MPHWQNGNLTTKDYTYLLNRPYSLHERQAAELENILAEFPYLQSARAIYLKGLYNKDSFRYNTELKKTAAYTADRSVLFDFITSEEFRSIDRELLEEQEKAISEITVDTSESAAEAITPSPSPVEKLEQSIKNLIKESKTESNEPQAEAEPVQEQEIPDSNIVTEPEPAKAEAEEPAPAQMGKPLAFDAAETHSFSEWLQLSRLKPIEREPREAEEKKPLDEKINLIDRFIEASPKITPVKGDPSPWENLSRTTTETPGLMTETLARVYVEQKKYAKAIQAYEILILKYPEKSVFFANRISEIKDLQQNNK